MGKWSRSNSKEYTEWRKKVLEKNGNICKTCGTDKKLHCHHIIPWEKNEKSRFIIENGEIFCSSCHLKHEREINPLRFWKGKTFSDEHRENLRKSHLGISPPNKGKRMELPKSQICKYCKIEKLISEFYLNKGYWPRKECKSCNIEIVKKRK